MKKKRPELRFSGFDNDWEQRKLGDVVERVTCKNENNESTLPLTISAQYGLIDQNEFFNKRIASKDISGYYLIHKGEFAYNKSTSSDAPCGAIKRLDRYKSGVLSTLYIVFKILDESKINSDYLVTYYDTFLWHKGVRAIAAEGARNHGLLNIAPVDFFKTTVLMPKSIGEQREIGLYFKRLDHLITLHRCECTKLICIKKSMLENMFPQKGEKIPRIRFSGFTDDWEQRKLLDVAPLQRGFDLPASQMKEGKYPVVMSNGIGGYHSEYKVKGPGIITGRSGTIGKLHYIEENYWPHNTALWVTDFKGNYSKFIFHLYRMIDLSHYETGSGVPTLNRNDVHDAKVFVPRVEEQRCVAVLLDSLDHLITLHQRKLGKLQNIKKAMLEKMFV